MHHGRGRPLCLPDYKLTMQCWATTGGCPYEYQNFFIFMVGEVISFSFLSYLEPFFGSGSSGLGCFSFSLQPKLPVLFRHIDHCPIFQPVGSSQPPPFALGLLFADLERLDLFPFFGDYF